MLIGVVSYLPDDILWIGNVMLYLIDKRPLYKTVGIQEICHHR